MKQCPFCGEWFDPADKWNYWGIWCNKFCWKWYYECNREGYNKAEEKHDKNNMKAK